MKTSKLKNRRGSHIGVQPHLFATGMCGFVIVGTQFEYTDTVHMCIQTHPGQTH